MLSSTVILQLWLSWLNVFMHTMHGFLFYFFSSYSLSAVIIITPVIAISRVSAERNTLYPYSLYNWTNINTHQVRHSVSEVEQVYVFFLIFLVDRAFAL